MTNIQNGTIGIKMENAVSKNTRIETVDALRGFAVMAIILVHNLEHFIFPVYPENTPAWLNVLDQGVLNVVFSLFAGKAYAIFALLFGFTFYIQWNNRKLSGKDFGYRFLWRMVLLLFFATLNAAFFPAGDVLLLFAAASIVLFITRNWSDRAILITSVILLLQPVEWFHYFASLVNTAHQLPDLKVDEMYAEVAEYTKGGNFPEFLWCNITLGQKASLMWAVNAGRYIQTAGTALDMWQKLAFTMVLISSFVLLYQNRKFSAAVGNLRFYGKMSLTNYISQSVIGALIYFPFGLYLAPHCGYTVSLLIGIAVFFLQVMFCKWWLKSHRQGPLEFIWHKWTWIGTGK